MKKIEIRWHGKGGQGVKTASLLLAEGINETPLFAQAFPEYGPERTGSPIEAYNRISEKEILAHYPLLEPNIVVIADLQLPAEVYEKKTTKKTIFLFPAEKSSVKNRTIMTNIKSFAQKHKIRFLNMGLVGAVVGILEKKFKLPAPPILAGIKKRIDRKFPPRLARLNFEFVQAGYKETKKIKE
ncbi:2-oxoacid:acceptor oxidoreductase family protein [bacterium]|nr:2-oxoacid:acceptor oxidoreductase family protein [bacterium]